MKKNVFKLISGILATTVLLTGCNDGETTPFDTSARNMTVAETGIKLSDYFEYDDSYKYVEYASSSIKDLTALYGQKVYSYDNFFVFKKITKDFKNNVKEEFSVYNAETGEVVKTLINEYYDGNYDQSDEFGNDKKAPKTLDVSIQTRSGISLIKVVEKTNAPIDESIIEEEELNESYATSINTKYYDIKGVEITSSNLPISAETISSSDTQTKIRIGKTIAIFDDATGALVDSWDTETTQKPALYEYQNDKYGFYFGDGYSYPFAFEAYDIKTGKLVCRYYYGNGYMGNAVVLNSGNVLVQKIKTSNEYDYDVNQGGMYFKLETLLVDASSGKAAKVEGCNYLFSSRINELDLEEYGVKFTDKKTNVLIANGISDKEYGEREIVFLSDDLKIEGVYDGKVVINQEDDFVVPEKVANDLYIVDIEDPAYSAFNRVLIDANNNVINYVPETARVVGNYIYTSDGIYNKYLEKVVDYQEFFSSYDSYNFQGMVGSYAVFTYEYETYDSQKEQGVAVIAPSYSSYNSNMISNASIVDIDSDYLLIYNESSSGYVLYNAQMNSILSSQNSMALIKAENNLIVETVAYGKNAVYFFNGNGGAL